MPDTDYRALCQEIFGTDEEAQIRQLAAAWKRKSTRNAGRKRALSEQDMVEITAMLNSGASIQEIADAFHVSRQSISQYLNDRPGEDYTMRLDFKLGTRVCTVIYVDFLHERIKIQNRTDDVLNRAFGVNEEPNWQDFESFLLSRCFPKSRGYAKQILRGLGVSGYDSLGIVEATGGRTAEDNMYLTVRSYPKEVSACEAH